MENNGNKTALRVGFVRYLPAVFNSCTHFPELGPRKKCPFPGYCIEMLKVIVKKLNMAIEPVLITTNSSEIDVGELHKDGHWSGVLGAIANGTVDTACIFYQETESRKLHFDFSVPIYTTHSRIAVRSQTADAGAEMWRLFMPYKLDTWLCILSLLFIQMALFALISRVEWRLDYGGDDKNNNNFISLPQIVWRTIRMQLLQPEAMHFRCAAGRMQLIIFGLFQCIIFTSVYQFWIVSSLVQSKPTSPFKDGSQFHEEFMKGKYKLVSQYKGHWFYEQLEHSTTYPFKEMREISNKQHISQAHYITEALELVRKGDHVLLLQGDDPAYFRAAKFCDIVFVDRELPSMTSHLAFAKGNSGLRDQFNEAINEELIFLRRIYERYQDLREIIRNQECNELLAKHRRYQPLSLVPFLGVLILFGACMGVAFFVYLVEKFFAAMFFILSICVLI